MDRKTGIPAARDNPVSAAPHQSGLSIDHMCIGTIVCDHEFSRGKTPQVMLHMNIGLLLNE